MVGWTVCLRYAPALLGAGRITLLSRTRRLSVWSARWTRARLRICSIRPPSATGEGAEIMSGTLPTPLDTICCSLFLCSAKVSTPAGSGFAARFRFNKTAAFSTRRSTSPNCCCSSRRCTLSSSTSITRRRRRSRHKGAARWGLQSIRGVTGHSAGGERACAGGSGRSGAGLGSERSRPRGPSESGSHSGRPRPCPPSCPR